MKRDLRLGSSARSMATRWRPLARGRWDIENATAKSVVAKAAARKVPTKRIATVQRRRRPQPPTQPA
jgi:hypothetical protein